jgi:rhodanese-related sulfurtransferase
LVVAGSDDGVALLLEDPERTSPHGDEVPLLVVVHLRLGGRRPAGAVDYLALAGYSPLAYGPEEVDVQASSCTTYWQKAYCQKAARGGRQ